ncbi:MAG TPA: DUF302 domain-containing protein [Candidatus Acidoferrales bacterium]|nr:DUF302 domain-containing protein [Candidatus Acidoferrales bacterium]
MLGQSVGLRYVLGVAVLGLAAIPISGSAELPLTPAISSTSVTHVDFKSPKPFDDVTTALEKQLGRFDSDINRALGTAPPSAAEAESKVRAMEGSSGLMIFSVRDHGKLLALKGRKSSARQYEIGNPLIALQMTQEDVRAGEYAPLRIYVYAGDDNFTHVDYDLPSSLFGRFHSLQVDKVAKGLDQKLETLVHSALGN